VHKIENTSLTERLYTVTIMARDAGALPGGFAALVDAGTAIGWDDTDRGVLSASTPLRDPTKHAGIHPGQGVLIRADTTAPFRPLT